MKKKKLSPKRLKFCQEYMKTGNATQSAIKAGYSKKTATSQGSNLLTFVEVIDYIDKHQTKLMEKCNWDRKRIVEKLEELLEITNLQNNGERQNYLKALQEIAKMFGVYEAEKHDINVTEFKFKLFNDDEDEDEEEDND